MKLVLLAVVVIFAIPGFVVGQSAKQNGALETEIRRLDHAEAEGLLHKDVVALDCDGSLRSPGSDPPGRASHPLL